ncbi:hypothetical protein AB0M46_50885, partial [Dactylosporangium sp. NPDC051485]|uniref:hypothetical protein n=1 Tax=Dactylosporangium sp. NPDC051485 TaxID=3154846 RepID=UPI00343B399C
KEPAPAECAGGVLNGGDTGEVFLRQRSRVLVLSATAWNESGSGSGERIGTLLGPETTSAEAWRLVSDEIQDCTRTVAGLAGGLGVKVLGLVLVENCTVDASIFKALWSSC